MFPAPYGGVEQSAGADRSIDDKERISSEAWVARSPEAGFAGCPVDVARRSVSDQCGHGAARHIDATDGVVSKMRFPWVSTAANCDKTRGWRLPLGGKISPLGIA